MAITIRASAHSIVLICIIMLRMVRMAVRVVARVNVAGKLDFPVAIGVSILVDHHVCAVGWSHVDHDGIDSALDLEADKRDKLPVSPVVSAVERMVVICASVKELITAT
jgi:hypothetical protein